MKHNLNSGFYDITDEQTNHEIQKWEQMAGLVERIEYHILVESQLPLERL